MSAEIYYVAYGMLTDPDAMDHNEFVGRGLVRNYGFEFRYFANVIKSPGSQLYGTVWNISEQELSYLDEIEGYPLMYTRVKVEVQLDDGEKVLAEMYTMTPEMREQIGPEYPTKKYMDRLLSGYRHADLPMSQLTKALEQLRKTRGD